MDKQSLHFALTRAAHPGRAARRAALASAATALALLLAGCSEDRVQQLEERVNLVEAKADSAEKRAKAAEAMAAQTPQIVQPDPAPINDLAAGDEDPATDVTGDGDPAAAPPPADNGKAAAAGA
jgi:hypothetical protein